MERLRKNRKSFYSVLSLGRRAKFYFFLAFSLFVMILSFLRPDITKQVKVAAIDSVSPVLSFINRPFEEASEGINSISNIAALKAENSRLKAENERLKEWYQTALMLRAENKSLESLLNLKVDPQIKYISARALSDTQNTFSKTILISTGSNEGIKQNQVVLSGEGVLGRVIDIGKKTSRVLLISDVNSRIPVTIEGINKKAVLSGNNGDYLLMKHLEFTSQDMVGKQVITNGQAGIFPAGLAVGKIIKIENNSVFVRPFSKMQNIQFVRILEKGNQENITNLGVL